MLLCNQISIRNNNNKRSHAKKRDDFTTKPNNDNRQTIKWCGLIILWLAQCEFAHLRVTVALCWPSGAINASALAHSLAHAECHVSESLWRHSPEAISHLNATSCHLLVLCVRLICWPWVCLLKNNLEDARAARKHSVIFEFGEFLPRPPHFNDSRQLTFNVS